MPQRRARASTEIGAVRASIAALLLLGCGNNSATPDASVSDVADGSTGVDATTMDVAQPTDTPAEDVPPMVDGGFGADPLSWSVHVPGPFHSGYRNFPLTYYPPGLGGPRSTTIHVWYPTTATTGDHPTYFQLFPDPGAITNAPLSAPVYPSGKYPVMVYSHGDRGFGATSYFLSDFLATHGWVVVAPDHTGDLLSDADGYPFNMYWLRSMDISAALDSLDALPVGDPLHGLADTSHVLLVGHSFGTHTVWSSSGGIYDTALIQTWCAAQGCVPADIAAFAAGGRDTRVVASEPLAGAIDTTLFGPVGYAGVHIPMLAMSGTDNPVGDDVQYADVTPVVDLTWIEVTGGCHQFFALGGCADIADNLQVPIVGAWTLAFARRYVLGDMSSQVTTLLNGTASVSTLVTYHHR